MLIFDTFVIPSIHIGHKSRAKLTVRVSKFAELEIMIGGVTTPANIARAC